ncbi:MAG: hypothetical protein GY701_12975, partial [Sulfitobacter sp.]|nr:hypothetical protein [Sulfitobacter sp.]
TGSNEPPRRSSDGISVASSGSESRRLSALLEERKALRDREEAARAKRNLEIADLEKKIEIARALSSISNRRSATILNRTIVVGIGDDDDPDLVSEPVGTTADIGAQVAYAPGNAIRNEYDLTCWINLQQLSEPKGSCGPAAASRAAEPAPSHHVDPPVSLLSAASDDFS